MDHALFADSEDRNIRGIESEAFDRCFSGIFVPDHEVAPLQVALTVLSYESYRSLYFVYAYSEMVSSKIIEDILQNQSKNTLQQIVKSQILK